MHFSLSPEQQSFQDLARQFSLDHLAPNAIKWDAEEIFPVDKFREAAKLGFAGLYVNPDHGGLASTDTTA